MVLRSGLVSRAVLVWWAVVALAHGIGAPSHGSPATSISCDVLVEALGCDTVSPIVGAGTFDMRVACASECRMRGWAVPPWHRRLQNPMDMMGNGSALGIPGGQSLGEAQDAAAAGQAQLNDALNMSAEDAAALNALGGHLDTLSNMSAADAEAAATALAGQYAGQALDSLGGMLGSSSNQTAITPMNQTEAIGAAMDMLAGVLGEAPEPVNLTVAGVMLRLPPIGMSCFVSYFGNKVATIVRVGSVFWASAAPTIIPTIQQMVEDNQLTVTTFMAFGGSIYAGFLGSFAAVKSKGFGIAVQGMSLAYIVSAVAQGYVIAEVVKEVPAAAGYTDWVSTFFTLGLGGAIAKVAIQFEDLISVAATAAIGSYTILQLICSFGFESTRNLSLYAAVGGNFGCTDAACRWVLNGITTFGAMGTANQVMMGRIMKKMVADPNFVGNNFYERALVKVNSAFAIIFTLNDVVDAEGEEQSEEEKAELSAKKDMIMMQIGTVASDIGGVALSSTMFVSVFEGFTLGCFPLDDSRLVYFAGALAGVGVGSVLLTKYQITTNYLPIEQRPRRNKRLKIHLLLAAFLIPIEALCLLFTMLIMDNMPYEVPQAKEFFDIDKQPFEVQDALRQHVPVIAASVTGLLTTTVAGWVLACKKLGGLYFVLMKLLSMISWTMIVGGGGLAYVGYNMGTDGMTAQFDPTASTLYTILTVVGGFIAAVGVLAIVGMKMYDTPLSRILGRILLNVYMVIMALLLIGDVILVLAIAWYMSQLGARIDDDWAKYQRHLNSTEYLELTASNERVNAAAKNMTKERFVELVEGSYTALTVAAGVVFVILLGGVLSAFKIVGSSQTLGKSDSMLKGITKGATRKVLCAFCMCCPCCGPGGNKQPDYEKMEKKAEKKKNEKLKKEKKKRRAREKKLREKEERKYAEAVARGEIDPDPCMTFLLPMEIVQSSWEAMKTDMQTLMDFAQAEGKQVMAPTELNMAVELLLIAATDKLEAESWEQLEQDPDATYRDPLEQFEVEAVEGNPGLTDFQSDSIDPASGQMMSGSQMNQTWDPMAPVGMRADNDAGEGGKKKRKKKRARKNKRAIEPGPAVMSAEEAEEQRKLQLLWDRIDLDNSGFLDESEVRQVMDQMGKAMDGANFNDAMQEIDKDGSGELDFNEFLAWWQKQDPEAQKQLQILHELTQEFDEL